MKTKKQLYTEQQIADAHDVVRARIYEVLHSMGKQSMLIAYLIDPDCTAIGCGYEGNIDVFDNAIYNNLASRDGLEYDGNAGHTLIDLADMILKGEV